MEAKYVEFLDLLHRAPATQRRVRRRRTSRGAIIAGCAALALIGSGAALWATWPAWLNAIPARATMAPAASPQIAVSLPLPPAPPVAAGRADDAPPQLALAIPVGPAAKSTEPPPWIRYAVAAPPKDSRPRIAIVIDDLGLDRRRTERAILLPPPLTLSFLAYASDLPRQTEAAHRAGHELMLHVPMEPIGKVLDIGPNQLEVGMSREEVLKRLDWDLARFDGYVGVNNHMGSRFTGDSEAMRPVMETLRARGLLFLDSRTTGQSAGGDLARAYGVPHAARDVFLDNEISAAAIDAQLVEVERIARRMGSAIAIGHPHDQTLDALQRWLGEIPEKGFVLVPVSAIVKDRGGAIAEARATGEQK